MQLPSLQHAFGIAEHELVVVGLHHARVDLDREFLECGTQAIGIDQVRLLGRLEELAGVPVTCLYPGTVPIPSELWSPQEFMQIARGQTAALFLDFVAMAASVQL